MKKIFFVALAIFSLQFISCKKENTIIANDIEGLLKVQEISNDTNTLEIYTKSGKFIVGHNEVFMRVKSIASGAFATDVTADWMPMMHMMMHSHSCPKTAITKVAGKTALYKGDIFFQMAGNTSEKWTLKLNYQTGGLPFVVEDTIDVPNSTRKTIAVVTGSDSKKYVLALMSPENPIIGINDIKVGLFKMESMTSFPSVANYTIEIDPRMPSMGNHGSPNNVNLTYSPTDSLYHGKLSMSMTGYWKINMILKNEAAEELKGEAVTVDNESSTLFFEIEF